MCDCLVVLMQCFMYACCVANCKVLVVQINVLEARLAPLKKGVSTISLKDYEGVNKVRCMPRHFPHCLFAHADSSPIEPDMWWVLQLLSKYVEAWQKRKRIFNDVWCAFHASSCSSS